MKKEDILKQLKYNLEIENPNLEYIIDDAIFIDPNSNKFTQSKRQTIFELINKYLNEYIDIKSLWPGIRLKTPKDKSEENVISILYQNKTYGENRFFFKICLITTNKRFYIEIFPTMIIPFQTKEEEYSYDITTESIMRTVGFSIIQTFTQFDGRGKFYLRANISIRHIIEYIHTTPEESTYKPQQLNFDIKQNQVYRYR